MDIDRDQFEVADGRGQFDLVEVLGQQPRQVLDVASRLGCPVVSSPLSPADLDRIAS